MAPWEMGNASQHILASVRVVCVDLDVLPSVRPSYSCEYELYKCCVWGHVYFQRRGMVCLRQVDVPGTDQGGEGIGRSYVYAIYSYKNRYPGFGDLHTLDR